MAATKTYAMPVQISRGEDIGYRAECTILPGCFVDGDTLKEVLTDIQEAIVLYIQASNRLLKKGSPESRPSGLWRGSVPMCRDRFKSPFGGWGKTSAREFFSTLLRSAVCRCQKL